MQKPLLDGLTRLFRKANKNRNIQAAQQTERFVQWAIARDKIYRPEDVRIQLERLTGLELSEAPSTKTTGPLTVGESVQIKGDNCSDETNEEQALEFNGQFGRVDSVDAQGFVVLMSTGEKVRFNGHKTGKTTGVYRGTPPEESKGNLRSRKEVEIVYLSEGSSSPSPFDLRKMQEFLDRGHSKGESRSLNYLVGPVVKLALSKSGSFYFQMLASQRDGAFRTISPNKGKVLYVGLRGKRPSGWEQEASELGIEG